ncbi:MAG: UMP kinase [Deltaproteobacteria bacterium]|nr:UMP kinase [Deltaproteobacteria bacterium]
MLKPVYQRILLKISGEALAGGTGFGIMPNVIQGLAAELKETTEMGVQTAMVIGGGNIFRGIRADDYGLDRVSADHIGMLATVLNSIAFRGALLNHGVPAVVLSAIPIGTMVEPYNAEKAVGYLNEGKVVIMAAGTGNPFFTTDTAAALRALEVRADALFKGTKVDGIYDSDPVTNPTARRFNRLTYDRALALNLKVMDTTAISLAKDGDLRVVVFDLTTPGNLVKIITGSDIGTVVRREESD